MWGSDGEQNLYSCRIWTKQGERDMLEGEMREVNEGGMKSFEESGSRGETMTTQGLR